MCERPPCHQLHGFFSDTRSCVPGSPAGRVVVSGEAVFLPFGLASVRHPVLLVDDFLSMNTCVKLSFMCLSATMIISLPYWSHPLLVMYRHACLLCIHHVESRNMSGRHFLQVYHLSSELARVRTAVDVKGAAEYKYLRDIRKKISSFACMVRSTASLQVLGRVDNVTRWQRQRCVCVFVCSKSVCTTRHWGEGGSGDLEAVCSRSPSVECPLRYPVHSAQGTVTVQSCLAVQSITIFREHLVAPPLPNVCLLAA